MCRIDDSQTPLRQNNIVVQRRWSKQAQLDIIADITQQLYKVMERL